MFSGVGIENNAEEEKRQKQINQRHQKLREKFKSKKITEPHINLLFIREITWEKKRTSQPLCTMALTII